MRATSTTPSAPSSSNRRSAFAVVCPVDDFALTLAERRLFEALNGRGVRYILRGMGAALLEGAPVATQDLDIWFEQPRQGSGAASGAQGDVAGTNAEKTMRRG